MYEEKEPTKKNKKESKFIFKEKNGKIKKEKRDKVAKTNDTAIKNQEVATTEVTDTKKSKKILSIKADWISILIKFAIFLVFAFIIIFIVTRIQMNSNKKSFTENIETMKEVAYNYYKEEENRPYEVNEEVILLLKDMIETNLIKELEDKEGNVCSYEYSYASLIKKTDTNFDLNIYLSCGGEAQEATYNVTYASPSDTDSPSEVTVLYELKRTVTNTEKYTCPEGYVNSGRYCLSLNNTVVVDATPIYRVTPEKNVKAKYKSGDTEYEYADPILVTNENNLKCPRGYDLQNGICIKETPTKYRSNTTYTCPNGGTPSGSRCLFTTSTNYSNRKAYCQRGTLINGDECYVTKDYSLKCLTGKKDSSRNACYTTYTASKELSDWLFDGKVKYSENKDIDRLESDTVRYEVDTYNDNGTITYRKYIRKYVKVCDDDDTLSGSICKHYDEAYEQRYCTGDYSLTSDKSECYTYEEASYKRTDGSYTCPDGYRKRGSGEDATCYRYEDATKVTAQSPYCASGYDLTSDNRCVKTTSPIIDDEESYTCPEGYTKRGSGSSTVCYKKTTTESYYYCSNSEATLDGTRCIIPSKTKFIAYRCPNGYDLSGNQCIKTDVTERILATENDTTTATEETIWSKTKDLEGWTWTGNTKEA